MLADVPYRVEAGRDMPVLILIKDADKYPVIISEVTIMIKVGHLSTVYTFEVNAPVNSNLWKKVLHVKVPHEFRNQTVEVDVRIDYEINNKKKMIHNDNFTGLSHKPFFVFAAVEPQPCFANWFPGDLHFHTDYTNDQVEFGAPMDAAVEMAHGAGLSFFAATDHSYDLDDWEDNYLENDPDLKKWKKSREEIVVLNSMQKDKMVILPGEEVSCSNEEGRNVHCLVLDHETFMPGSGDSAERWLKTEAELSISDVIKSAAPSGLVIAAHPKDPVPWLEKILIRRGSWSAADCRTHGINGLQILNGIDNHAFNLGLKEWVLQLLEGRHTFIFAGNDAHGNFNRYRQVKIPMLRLHEMEGHQAFGWARTVVWMGNDEFNVKNIISHLRSGNAVITNGPLVVFTLSNPKGDIFQIGETARGENHRLHMQGKTNREFGDFIEIKVIAGRLGGSETVLRVIKPESALIESEIALPTDRQTYIRCEAKTSKDLFCYTNPIWVENS